MWKVFVAVVALQIACTLQAPMENGAAEMMMKMMMQKLQHKSEAKGRDDGDDMGEEGMRALIQHYMQKNDISEDDEPGPELLEHYVKIQQHQINWVKMLHAGDLMTKTMMKDLFYNPEGPGQFAKTLVLKSIHDMVEPATDKKKIMGMLFEYLMKHPHGEKSEMATMMLKHLTAQVDGHDKGVIRAMMLHMLPKAKGEQKELLKELLTFLMSDDTAGEMQSTEMLMLMIQQYVSQQDLSDDKKAMFLLILHGLSERKDKQGRDLLRKLVFKSLMIMNEDQPEEEQWKYYPPGPCEVSRTNGQVLSSHECPDGYACNVGPRTYNFDNNNLRFTMCNYTGNNFVFHACKVKYPNDVEVEMPCGTGNCDFGPFTVTGESGSFEATFCPDYANYTVNVTQLDSVLIRACAVEDSSGYRSVQRRCPYGTKCGGPKFQTEWDGHKLHATVCRPDDMGESHDGKDFMAAILDTSLGFWEENEMEGDGGNEMGGGNMAGNMTNGSGMDADFIHYIITKLWAQEENGGDGMDDMEEDPDVIAFKIMVHLIHKMADDNKVLTKFAESVKIKHYMGIVEDADRVFMHGIIRHLLAIWFKMERGEMRQEGDLEDLLAFLMHKKQHEKIQDHLEGLKEMMLMEGGRRDMEEDNRGNIMEMLKKMMMEKHEDHHEEIEEKLKKLFKMMMMAGGKDEDNHDDDGEQMMFIKKLFEKMMQ